MSDMSVDGLLAGIEVKGLRVDTGADRTVVHQDFIPKTAYTGRSMILDSWRGAQTSKHRVARITIKIGLVEEVKEVAVVDTLDCPALLGSDLSNSLKVEMMGMVMDKLKSVQPVDSGKGQQSEITPVRNTRSQVKREILEEKEDALASAQADNDPLPLSEILDFPDSYFEEDPVPTPVSELSTWPEGEEVCDIPLPNMGRNVSDVSKLVKEQQADVSLQKLLVLGKNSEKGYEFVEGILVQNSEDSLGDIQQRVVVPVGRRQQILGLAHSNLGSGHFGFKKTFAKISRHFLWPRMWGQVKDFVRSCAGCQRAARNDNSRAPL